MINIKKIIKTKKEERMNKCLDSFNLIKEKTPNFLKLFKNVNNILIDKYRKGDAIAATFADEKTIILTIPENISTIFLASILIHEATHINHYIKKPDEYLKNQIKAEKLAFKNEIFFLKTTKQRDLIEDAIFTKDKLLNFLKENKNINSKKISTRKLIKENINMSRHKKILNNFLIKKIYN